MVRREDLIPGETKRIISWDDVKRDFSGRKFFSNIHIMRIRNCTRGTYTYTFKKPSSICRRQFFYSINIEERSFSSFSIFNCRRIPIFVSLFVSNLHRYIGSTMYNNNSGNNDNNNIDLQFMLHGMEYKLLIITGKEYLLTEAAVSYT